MWELFGSFNIFIYIFKYKTIETHALTFLPLNISAVGVNQDKLFKTTVFDQTPFLMQP